MPPLALVISIALLAVELAAQPAEPRGRIREFRTRNEGAIVRELAEFLALPNVATSSADIRRNADHLRAMMTRRGITSRLLELPGVPVSVYGELRSPGATRTVVFYAHFDGQPVDRSKWTSDPWRPLLRSGPPGPESRVLDYRTLERFDPEARLYARSASDDKSPIIAIFWALDALKAAGVSPSVNLKFFFEGEEEAGSANLRALLTKYRDLLDADFWIFSDGPVHQSRALQIVFGVRGVVGLDLTVYGPNRPLHSGHYGNWAPNPNAMLVHLLASMRDLEGRITIPGFSDDVRAPTEAERAAFRALPPVEADLIDQFGLGRTEGAPSTLAERLALPALNLSGLSGGLAGREGGSNVIVPEASAYLDFRLVPDQTPARVRQLVEEHLRRAGYHLIADDPDSTTRRAHARLIRVRWSGGYPAARTSLDHPGARALAAAADRAWGTPLLRVPTLGGSLPLDDFVAVLGAPFAILPIVNHDNNQHGENENLRLQNLWDGIELYAGVLAGLGREWVTIP
jgi:acetylornithine deacetylase/succinyl-diaminopimelate desuccinylase-like protein